MYEVMIKKDGEHIANFKHYSPDSLSKMFNNVMIEEERKIQKVYIDPSELKDQVETLDKVLAGQGRILA